VLLWAVLAIVLVVIVIAATVVILVLLVDKPHRPAVIEALVPVLVALVSMTGRQPLLAEQLGSASQARDVEDQ
jgi:hypothetical protein